MSDDNLNTDKNEIHYICGDSEEYILGDDELSPELQDLQLICSDGSRAVLVNGQYIVTDNEAIFLQGGDSDLTEYYINENSESYIVDESSNNTVEYETTECVQVVDENTSSTPQIMYFVNDDSNTGDLSNVHELKEVEVAGIQDEDGNIYPFKRIKLEGQLLNFDEFVQQQEDVDTQETNDCESVKYAILESGNSLQPTKTFQQPENHVDLAKITGRNLITGQTVTLDSYMEKLKRRLNKTTGSNSGGRRVARKIYNDTTSVPKLRKAQSKRPELSDLLDKKISIGTTKTGKKIVGKIIHVERKNLKTPEKQQEETPVLSDPDEITGDIFEEETEEEPKSTDSMKILVKKSIVSIESFEEISKTLGGVMEMESVRRKLENKNIVVKLVEKRYNSEAKSYVKSTNYSYGYMEQEHSDDGTGEKWKFVPDQETQDVLLGVHAEGDEPQEKKSTRFGITTSLTILITYEKSGMKTIRVNLNPAPGNLCTICAQYFKSNLHLRYHMDQVHNTYGNNTNKCDICEITFDDAEKLQEHRAVHVEEGRLFTCTKCDKCFNTQAKLQKHLPTHDVYLRPLECSVCEVRCANESALKKHLLTHTGIKPYACEICGKQFVTMYDMNTHKKNHFMEKQFVCNVCMRTFSRHSNLLRHMEIHKGTGALYKCDICSCSYNYISSLTRHMVQNHVVEKV